MTGKGMKSCFAYTSKIRRHNASTGPLEPYQDIRPDSRRQEETWCQRRGRAASKETSGDGLRQVSVSSFVPLLLRCVISDMEYLGISSWPDSRT